MRERLAIAGILGGLAVIVVLAVVILKIGQYESPPSLEDDPNPAIPGELVWLDDDQCVVRAAASGATRQQVYCLGQYKNQLSWVDANRVAYVEYGPSEPLWMVLDLTTQQVTGSGVSATPYKGFISPQESVKGESVQVDDGGKVYVIAAGQRTLVHDFDTPEGRWPQFAAWSPDGEWILLSYWRPRGNGAELWIMSRDGKTRGTIASDVEPPMASWRIDGVGVSPAFEGLDRLR